MVEQTSFTQLVVVGSSAGGIEALSTLVSSLPADFPAPIVIAQHLDPNRPSHLAEILARRTPLKVRMVLERESLEGGVVFVVPANRIVEISDNEVWVSITNASGPRPSVDVLLTSAAQVYGERLIAVILTGNGSDGAAGAREVSSRGGTVIVQNPDTASFPSMPLSLSPTTVDIVANIENIGGILADLTAGIFAPTRPTEERALRNFLEQLRDRSGIDFNTYKMPTIMRRLQRRMVATGSNELTGYLRYLQAHPEEYQRLVSSFLIKVTEFFRDTELFDALRNQILPELIREAEKHDYELRFWSAGTATGEEAYSLAILISDVLGDDLEKFTIRIFATDLDNDAVSFARRGIYPAAALAAVDPALVARYFTQVNGEYEIRKSIRALTIFGQHDLGQRAPFPRTDLILCRNVLIYFTMELQRRALQLFAFSLRDSGFLVLGKAETNSPLAEYFTAEVASVKIYRRYGKRILIPPARIRETASSTPTLPRLSAPSRMPTETMRIQRDTPALRTQRERYESLVRSLPVGIAVVDRHYDVQIINSIGRRLLGIHSSGVGDDIIHLAQNIPSDPLRAAINAAFRGEPVANIDEVAITETSRGELRYLRIACYPQKFDESSTDAIDAVLVMVEDATLNVIERRDLNESLTRQRSETERLISLMSRLAETNRQLMDANQELNRNNAEMRSANEEFLVANEEAQAATEEIETLNEELQATNEELETLNEELQATVEELNTTNDDLQARSEELEGLTVSLDTQRRESEAERARLAAILVSMGDAVLVIGEDGATVQTNAAYERMFDGADAVFVAADDNGDPLPPDARPQHRAAAGESFRMEFTLVTPDGVRRWFEANGQPIHSEANHGGVIMIRDISERSLRRLQDEFMAMASHELRTPLTTISGYLQLLMRHPMLKGDDRLRRYATLATEQVERLLRLVNELLDVSRLQTGKLGLVREPIELIPVVTRVIEAARLIERAPPIRLDTEEDTLLRVNADGGRIEQVMLNLLTNAITYAAESPEIIVRVRHEEMQAEITVQDFGRGIAPNELPHLFSRLYQVRRTEAPMQRGLGLGLFISREIITAHDGTIDVRSALGEGTTFVVRLPLEADAVRD